MSDEFVTYEQFEYAKDIADHFKKVVLTWKDHPHDLNQVISPLVDGVINGLPLSTIFPYLNGESYPHPEIKKFVIECVTVLSGDKEDTNPEVFHDLLNRRFHYIQS